MIIGLDRGHGVGQDRGAYREEEMIARFGDAISRILKANGQQVIELRPTSATSVGNSISQRISKANSNRVDAVLCLHCNAFNGVAKGSEILTYKAQDKLGASNILEEFATLGFANRGIKVGENVASITSKTVAPCILIEFGFSDNDEDYNRMNVNVEKMAEIVVRNAIGKAVTVPPAQDKPSEPAPPQNSDKPKGYWEWVERFQRECNAQGFSNQIVDGLVGLKTLAGAPQVKKGAKGNITKLLQELLQNGYGFQVGATGWDGDFGVMTEKAVKLFQQTRGLQADGIVGQATWKKLLGM